MTSPELGNDDQETIWQAEGVVMEVMGCGSTEANMVLRLRARAEARSLFDVATDVISGTRW